MDFSKYFSEEKTKGIVQILWIALFSIIAIIAALFIFISIKLIPDTSELENPKYELATLVYDTNGDEMDKIYSLNREWIKYQDLNPNIVDALIATEDVRFMEHSGIDARGTTRAVFYLSTKGGASTITQQLAKQFFTQRSSSFVKRVWQKLKEWVIAAEFEKRYTKEEILAMYLNKTDFLYNAIGIGSASKVYFGKDQKDLKAEEAATLIAMLKNPNLYNPVKNPDNSLNRRNTVLGQMEKYGYIDEEEYEKARATELDMANFKRPIYYNGVAPYFRAELIQWLTNLFNEDKYKKPDGTKYNPFTEGLKIYTTIDIKMQKYAEQAMKSHMSALQKEYFNSVNYDPWEKGADKELLKIRKNDLAASIKQTERYQKMRSKKFSKLTTDIQKEIPNARFLDADIFRLYNAEKDPSSLTKLINNKSIDSERANTYRDILKSKYWPSIKKQWEGLKKDVDKVFNTKIEMTVFDYEKGEKRVVMTPIDSIKYHQRMLQIGSIAVDPITGHIKSWIGGIDFKYFQYDHVESNRQVGSTFKPFIYSTAIIDHAMSPCQKIKDIQYSIPAGEDNFHLLKTWAPANSDGKFTNEWLTLKQCLKESKNSCSLYLMKEIGSTERVKEFVGNLGIDENKIPDAPSICLGTADLSVMDMATAYTAFANNGILTKPIFVTKIEDKNGKLIYANVPEQKPAINEAYNYVIVDLMKAPVQIIQKDFKNEIAGKTGTTDDYRDGWFMGYTPNLVIATWVGGEKQWVHFNNIGQGQGGYMARPFFVKYLKYLESDPSLIYSNPQKFPVPENPVVETDCSKYKQMESDADSLSLKQEKHNDILEDEF
ncbi:MAG TPA: transglycosylase domain-containing protein [Saprospiraceae bacterium]|nr:transglycosylase domain-containing protein [Saprospiraceae bacterium]